MARRQDFEPAEWQLLSEAATYAGLIVVLAQRGGSLWELLSIADAFADVRANAGQSQLLDDICAERPAIGRESFRSTPELRRHGLERIRAAVELVQRRADPADVEAFSSFLRHVAQAAAQAYPATDQPVSEAEADAIADVSAAATLAP